MSERTAVRTGVDHHLHGAFGHDAFGRGAERFARWFGTPVFLAGQTILVALWVLANVALLAQRWDPYPFILLNLLFSLQAAYAAPLILLAQTRQADRDRRESIADAEHREAISASLAEHQKEALARLDRLEESVAALTTIARELQGELARLAEQASGSGPSASA